MNARWSPISLSDTDCECVWGFFASEAVRGVGALNCARLAHGGDRRSNDTVTLELLATPGVR